MERNVWVFVGGLALMFICFLLAFYYSPFVLVALIIGICLYVYYEMTLSPEERARRREERERKEAERRHLEFVRKEARARAEGISYGLKYGYERAKDDTSMRRQPISMFGSSPMIQPMRDVIFGKPTLKRKKKKIN